jgi:cell division initiation protein
MKVSPLDLRQLRFKTRFRGFDKAEVMALIAEVTDDYEHALREVDLLRQEVSKMDALLNQHREHERDLRDTLITAQRVSDEIRTNADAQARNIVREAEGRSDLLLQKTQARLEDVQRHEAAGQEDAVGEREDRKRGQRTRVESSGVAHESLHPLWSVFG